MLPERVVRVASLVGLAPYGAENLDWLAGMTDHNRRQYGAAIAGRAALARVLYPEVIAMRTDPSQFQRRLLAQATAADHHVLTDPEYHATWLAGLGEAIGRSLDGWAADSLALTRPWGFEPASIRVPTLLWHGTRDRFSPVAHTRWLARRIRSATLLLSEHESHLNAVGAQTALRWLVPRRPAGEARRLRPRKRISIAVALTLVSYLSLT